MRAMLAAVTVALIVTPVVASDQSDVAAVVHRFIDALNQGDAKTACSTCATPSSIIDEFPPYGWQGATACADWAADFDAYNKKSGITDPAVTLAKARHVDVSGDRAYAVIPATFSCKEKGKKLTESGSVFTAALQKSSAGWVITGWAWSKH
jgi:ketosteroid isomerase-like protein